MNRCRPSHRVACLVFLLGSAAGGTTLLTAQSGALDGFADSVLPRLMKRSDVPGAVIAVVTGGTTVLLGHGYARLEDSTPADPRVSLFRTASVAKLFTATMVAVRAARAELDLDRNVNDYLRGVRVPDRDGPPVTLRALLTHTAGFDERAIGYAAPEGAPLTPLAEYLAARLPDRGWQVGEVTGYSNHGAGLAALVVEQQADREFRRLADDELFWPLGMARTHYGPLEDLTGLATGYLCQASECRPAPTLGSQVYPAGFAYTTAADMGRFIAAQLGTDSIPALTAAVRALLGARQAGHRPDIPGMALGFFEQRWRGVSLLTHSGMAPGFNALLVIVPTRRVGFFLAANGGRSTFGAEVLDSLLPLLLESASSTQPSYITLPLAPYAGHYQMTRYSHRTVERFPAVFVTAATVRVAGDTLIVPYGSRALRMRPIDDSTFLEVGGDRVAAFRRDREGRVTRLFLPAPAFGADFPATFERRSWFAAPYFLNEYVSWLAALPILLLVAWVAGAAIVRARRRGPGPTPSRISAAAGVLSLGATILFLAFGFGFIAKSSQQLAAGGPIFFGLSDQQRFLLQLPIVLLAAGIGMAALVRLAWRRQAGTRWGRVCFTALTVVVWAQLQFLVAWNYLPARW